MLCPILSNSWQCVKEYIYGYVRKTNIVIEAKHNTISTQSCKVQIRHVGPDCYYETTALRIPAPLHGQCSVLYYQAVGNM